MKTVSINVMNLCVPCENRCRYCLLSYDGKTEGIPYPRAQAYAQRFHDWLQKNRPDLSFLFGFGYSMEHPHLLDAVDFCQSIHSPSGEFLQLNGMKFRTDEELSLLFQQLKEHGVRSIDLTFYGTEHYHDRFSARNGDYQLQKRTLAHANQAGLDVYVSIPLTHENATQIPVLLAELQPYSIQKISCFIPHMEGRGRLLDPIRFSKADYAQLDIKTKQLINIQRFKTEQEWLQSGFSTYEKRTLTVTLTTKNVDYFENLPFDATIAYLEKLDDEYYASIPSVEELAKLYGNANGDCYYSTRDLYLHYQKRYIAEHQINIYDINDERQCFSRRY